MGLLPFIGPMKTGCPFSPQQPNKSAATQGTAHHASPWLAAVTLVSKQQDTPRCSTQVGQRWGHTPRSPGAHPQWVSEIPMVQGSQGPPSMMHNELPLQSHLPWWAMPQPGAQGSAGVNSASGCPFTHFLKTSGCCGWGVSRAADSSAAGPGCSQAASDLTYPTTLGLPGAARAP